MNAATPEAIVARLRSSFRSQRTHALDWRRGQLHALGKMLVEHEQEFTEALHQDLGKPPLESFVTEIGLVRSEIEHALRNLQRWARGTRVRVPLSLQPARARVVPQPVGVVLVIAPWNYPLQLLLAPLCGALAAGNCVLLKPSELAPATARVLARRIPEYLDDAAVAVVEGDAGVAAALLEQRFDHVFYTGGARVARIVALAAARHLCPVTLELGGKCPAIVSDGNMLAIARRLVHGKFLNAGQTCVAPDHVLVVDAVADELLRCLRQALLEFFGPDPADSTDYGRIINEDHFDRLVAALAGADVVVGGQHDREQRYIAPTIVLEPAAGSVLLEEEIFGPILPVIRVTDVATAIARVAEGPPPLAAYVFTGRADAQAAVEDGVRAGAIGVNACAVHLAVPGLPFGGVGESGSGRYHGKYSFDTFSQPRPVFSKGTLVDTLRLAYPPYSGLKARLLRKLF